MGDSYTVTSGVRRGSVYRCDVAGSWTLVSLAVPQLGAALGLFDGESILGRVGSNIRRWVNLAPRGVNADVVYYAGGTSCPAAASPAAGIILHNTTSVTTVLQATLPAPGALGPRTIAALVRPASFDVGQPYNHIVSWGQSGVGSGMFSICIRSLSNNNWGNHYWGSGRNTGRAVATATWAVAVVTYDGTDARFYVYDGAPGQGLVDTDTVALSGNPSAAVLAINSRIEDTQYGAAETAFAGAWDACLTAGEVATLAALLRERYGV